MPHEEKRLLSEWLSRVRERTYGDWVERIAHSRSELHEVKGLEGTTYMVKIETMWVSLPKGTFGCLLA